MDEEQRALEDLIRKMQDASATTEDFARANKAAESALMQFSKTTMADVSKGVAAFSGSVMAGERSFGSLIPIVSTLGKAVASVAKVFPLIGGVLGKGIEGATAGFEFLIQELDRTQQSFQQISQVGALGEEGLLGFRNMAANSMMSLAAFSQAIQTNSESLAAFGGATFAGTQDFATAIGRIAGPTGFARRLGLSVQDIADVTGDFMKIQATAGRQQMFTGDNLRLGTEAYIKQLDTLARLTGRSVKDLRDSQMQMLVDQRFAGMAAQMEDGGKHILDFIAGFPPELQSGIKDVITSGGVATTRAGEEILLRGSGAIINDLARSVRSEADITSALDQVRQMFADTEDAFAGAAAVGVGPTTLFGVMRQFSNRIMENQESIDASRQKQIAGTDKLVQRMTDAAINIDIFNANLEELIMTRALPMVAGGLELLTSSLNKLIDFIDGKIGGGPPKPPPEGTTMPESIESIDTTTAAGRAQQGNINQHIGAMRIFYNTELKKMGKELGLRPKDITAQHKDEAFQKALSQFSQRFFGNATVPPGYAANLEDMVKMAAGGIATGPKTGYLAQLHGTEAIVPLPDGDSIPVEMQTPDTTGTTTTAPGMGNQEQMAIMQTQVSRLDEMIRLMSRQIAATDKVRTAVS